MLHLNQHVLARYGIPSLHRPRPRAAHAARARFIHCSCSTHSNTHSSPCFMHTSPRLHSRNQRASHDDDRNRVRIAVAGKNRRSTGGYTPTVDRHSAAKRRPSPEGPRLTALAVFRPIDSGPGQDSPAPAPHRHVCKHGKCSSALSSSFTHPAPPVNARTASRLPCRFAATLPRAPTQAPLPDSGFSSTRAISRGHRASPRPPEPFPG